MSDDVQENCIRYIKPDKFERKKRELTQLLDISM